jgi:hypothetical protein
MPLAAPKVGDRIAQEKNVNVAAPGNLDELFVAIPQARARRRRGGAIGGLGLARASAAGRRRQETDGKSKNNSIGPSSRSHCCSFYNTPPTLTLPDKGEGIDTSFCESR